MPVTAICHRNAIVRYDLVSDRVAPQSQFEALQVEFYPSGWCTNRPFSQWKTTIYQILDKNGLETDLESAWTMTDNTHRINLTITASDGRQKANLVHQTLGIKAFQSRHKFDIKWKITTRNDLKANFALHRIIFEAKSQVIISRNCEFFKGKPIDSVFSPEVEARCTRKDLITA